MLPDQPLCFPNCTPTVELHEQIGTEMRPYLVLNSLQRLALY